MEVDVVSRSVALVIGFLLAASTSPSVSGQVEVPSNAALLRQAVEAAVHRAVGDFIHRIDVRVYLQANGDHPYLWLVTDAVASMLAETGHHVHLLNEGKTAPEEALVLSFRAIELGVVYAPAGRAGLFGPALIERKARAELSFRLFREVTGEVIWIGESLGEAVDRIDKGEAARQQAGYVQAVHVTDSQGSSYPILEPILITATIGGLIYLFYSSEGSD
jgi:hypothetical protein